MLPPPPPGELTHVCCWRSAAEAGEVMKTGEEKSDRTCMGGGEHDEEGSEKVNPSKERLMLARSSSSSKSESKPPSLPSVGTLVRQVLPRMGRFVEAVIAAAEGEREKSSWRRVELRGRLVGDWTGELEGEEDVVEPGEAEGRAASPRAEVW